MTSRIRTIHNAGVTLVELVLTIAVITVGVSGIMLGINKTVNASGDPMIADQAVAIGEAYLSEVTGKAFSEDAANGAAETYIAFGPDAGEANRTLYDDVDDYNGLNDVGARNQNNVLIAGLGDYTVNVAVTAQALNTIPAAPGNAKRVDVTVTHVGTGLVIVLSGYRALY